jgi:hypothetical protein
MRGICNGANMPPDNWPRMEVEMENWTESSVKQRLLTMVGASEHPDWLDWVSPDDVELGHGGSRSVCNSASAEPPRTENGSAR